MEEENKIELSEIETDKLAAAKTPFIMRKTDYNVVPYSGYIIRRRLTHIPVTREQAFFVMKNPSVNGPKVARFIAVTDGMKDGVVEKSWGDFIAQEGEKKSEPSEKKDEEKAEDAGIAQDQKRKPGRPPNKQSDVVAVEA